MSQGNPNKVNTIVEEIVKNNTVFKLKSPIEQEKEKSSIARSINSSLSTLNEVGKELVLQDLSVDPDEKFKGFIDSVGNIDIIGITKITATIVKGKIEEADREGLNLRNGEPIFNSSKITLSDSTLTLIAINTMVNNFKELSPNERELIANNWTRLTKTQQAEISNSYADIIQEKSKFLKSSSDRALAEMFSKRLKRNSRELKEETSDEEISENSLIQKKYKSQKFIEFIKNNQPKLYKEFLTYLEEHNDSINDIDILKIIDKFESFRKNRDILLAARFEKDKPQTELSRKLSDELEQAQAIYNVYTSIMNERSTNEINNVSEYLRNSKKDYERFTQKNAINSVEKMSFKTVTNMDSSFDNKTNQELQQLPIALSKANIQPEQIKEALTFYRNYISDFSNYDEDTIDQVKSCTSSEITSNFLDDFNDSFENGEINQETYDVLKIMSSISFNGNIQQILTNPQTREQFLQQFDQIINQDIEVAKDVKITGELGEIFGKYFEDNAVEMNTSLINEKENQQQEASQKASKPVDEAPAKPSTEEHTVPEEPSTDGEAFGNENTSNTAIAKQDNSFIGKVRRVMANMKDMKNKDSSKGFFSRLGASIQSVFGNKKEEYYEEHEDTDTMSTSQSHTQPEAKQQPTNYLNQHFEVNSLEAVRKTEESKNQKVNASLNIENRTQEEEEEEK